MPGPIIGELPEDERYAFAELCALLGAHASQLRELVEHGVAAPESPAAEPAQWSFTHVAVVRVHRALRLQHDLGVNAAGAALALDLLDEIARLRAALGTRADAPWRDA